MSIDKRLEAWHPVYQDWINNPIVRKELAARPNDDVRSVRYPRGRCPVSSQRGTLSETFSGEAGHHMSYAKVNQFGDVVVYDPSGDTGPYANPNQKEFRNKLAKIFGVPVTYIEVWKPAFSPAQNSQYDSFCQTWSLAWLHPDLQQLVIKVEKTSSEIKRIRALQEIVTHFVTNPICPSEIRQEFLDVVRPNFNRYWVNRGAYTTVRALRY